MAIVDLKHALSILSKSSPYAVSTEKSSKRHDILARYKDYIYIETPIETDFSKKLPSLQPNDIIFLCGSSGDGKSEILTRYNLEWKSKYDFHLDATHSFSPNQTAIQALDARFSANKISTRPLIVGINIGMLGNYAEEGSKEHGDIKNAIQSFLKKDGNIHSSKYIFMDFEQYPKFFLSQEGNGSDFVKSFIYKITQRNLNNPFFAVYENELKSKGHSIITANFFILGLKSVQDKVVNLLLKTRLIKDQFLTARALLDFIYQVLNSNSYLFDSLFSGGDNELLENIKAFDPANLHSRKIDEFIINFNLNIHSDEFIDFTEQMHQFGIYGINKAETYLRLLYLIGNERSLESSFVKSFKSEFENDMVEQYSNIWLIHEKFENSGQIKKEINRIYKELIITAIHRYGNRNSPNLERDVFFINERNGFKVAVELDVRPDFQGIAENKNGKIGYFNAVISVDGIILKPIPVSVNLLSLMVKINQGYRPNKHDKNVILLLDEIVEQIVQVANKKKTLFIIKGKKKFKISDEGNDYFEVSGV